MRSALRALGAELERRNDRLRVLRDLHAGQRRVVHARDDAGALAALVALLTHRRWGKTECFIRDAAGTCLRKRRAECAYVAQQRVNAKKLAWTMLHNLWEQYGWRCSPNNVELVWRFRDTDSTIELFGADDPRFQRLIRGRKFDRVYVDEAQDFIFSNLRHLTHRVLVPTLVDKRGRLFMGGTPGDHVAGVLVDDPDQQHYFYEVAWLRRHPEWTVLHGEFLENPHTAAELMEWIAKLKRANPQVEREPWFQREFYGRWVVDTRQLVVRLRPELNFLHEWVREDDDRFILGVDFGWRDPSAYVLATWNKRRYPWTVYLAGETAAGMYLHDHITKLRQYMAAWPGLRIVADPAGHAAALIAELRDVHGIPIEDADKREKMFHVERLNSEASLGLLKIFNLANPAHPEAHPLAQQWAELCWERGRGGALEEGTPRHLHDAALYARRAAAPWTHRPVEPVDPLVEQRLAMRKARFDRLRTQRRAGGVR